MNCIIIPNPQQVRGLVLIDPQVAQISAGDIFPLNLPLVGEYIMSVYMAPIMLPSPRRMISTDRSISRTGMKSIASNWSLWGLRWQSFPLCGAILQAEIHPILDAGHLPHYEQPEEVDALLVNFLDSIERK